MRSSVGEFLSVLIPAILGAGGGSLAAYVAIKSDLSELRARVINVEKSGDRAHDRLDNLGCGGGGGGGGRSRH